MYISREAELPVDILGDGIMILGTLFERLNQVYYKNKNKLYKWHLLCFRKQKQ